MHSNRFEAAQSESCVVKPPKQSCLEHFAFDSQPPYIQALTNSLALSLSCPESDSVNPTDSHTSKQLHIYIKTMGFKPSRITYLRMLFSKSCGITYFQKQGWGWGYPDFRNSGFRLSAWLHPRPEYRNPGKSNAEPSVAELSFHGTRSHSST